MTSSLVGIRQVADTFRAAAALGFHVSGSGVDVLVRAIADLQDQVGLLLTDATRLAEEPPLGDTPAARVYRPFMASLATDADQGYIAFLTALQEDLTSIERSLNASMTAYRDTDSGSGRTITDAGGTGPR